MAAASVIAEAEASVASPGSELSTIQDVFAEQAERRPDHPFVRHGQTIVSYRQMRVAADRLAARLHELGVLPRDRVALMLPNSSDYVACWLAIGRVGAVEVSVNTDFKGLMLTSLLEHATPRLLITTDRFAPELYGALRGSACRISQPVNVHTGAGSSIGSGLAVIRLDWQQEIDELPEPVGDVADLDPRRVAHIAYTSGTTGVSKGALIPHHRVVHTARTLAEVRGTTDEDVIFTPLPLFHGNAKFLSVAVAVVTGATVALSDRFSASRFWEEVNEAGATHFNYLGVMVAVLLKRAGQDRPPHLLRVGWGAGTPERMRVEFERRFGVTLLEGFGLTEGGIITSNRPDDIRGGSCGRPFGSYEVAIVDEWDRRLPAGEVGEISVRANVPYTQMLGYYRNAAATASSLRNGMLRTGDLGWMDEDGYMYYAGRNKDMIRRRGENISCGEVEGVLLLHPDIEEAAAFAVPSEVTEDDVMVVVSVREGADLAPERLVEYCRQEMPAFWVPRYVEIWRSGLPKTGTNKVTKAPLIERGVTADTWSSPVDSKTA